MEPEKKIEGLEFWPEEKFRDRSMTISGGGEVSVIPIPDDSIVCDYCNDSITEFPVPVYQGYALCPKCWKGTKKRLGQKRR